MTLPIIPLAVFEVKDKRFTGGSIQLKPFTVGQEAILLQVKDSKKESEILAAITQIAKECTVEPEKHDFKTMPFFLIELVFLKLREHSNGELVELAYRCKEDVESGVCNGKLDLTIDLREVGLRESPEYKEVFILHEAGEDSIGIEFVQPSIAMVESSKEGDIIETLAALTKKIFKGDEVWTGSDMTKEELKAFITGIPSIKKKEIMEHFFNSPPRIYHKQSIQCGQCGKVHELELEGISDFFG